MKPLILVASMIVLLIAGCSSSETVLGPENDDQQLEPACMSINAQLC
ncbi:MAG: hypothetical protein ACREK3_10455 [Gemmatimonadota bacterium]